MYPAKYLASRDQKRPLNDQNNAKHRAINQNTMMEEDRNKSQISEHRIEDLDSESDHRMESNDQCSDNEAEEYASADNLEFNKSTNHDEMESEVLLNEEEGHSSDPNSKTNPSQVFSVISAEFASREDASTVGESFLSNATHDSPTISLGVQTAAAVDENSQSEIAPIVFNTCFEESPNRMTEPVIDSRVAGGLRQQRASNSNILYCSCKAGEDKNLGSTPPRSGDAKESAGSIQIVQPLSPGLLTLATTNGVSMAPSSSIPVHQRNKHENPDNYYALASRSDSSSQFHQQGAVGVGTFAPSSALVMEESDSVRLSGEESYLASNCGRFDSAVVIDEEALHQTESKIKTDSCCGGKSEASDTPMFVQLSGSRISCLIFVVVVWLVAGLVVGLCQPSQITNLTDASTMNFTLLDDHQYLQDLFSAISGLEVFGDVSSPQSKAMESISRENQDGIFNVRNVGDQYLSERYALRVLYYSTKGDSWLVPDHNFDSTRKTCEWMNATQGNRLQCNDLGEVTDLFLNLAGLNGPIPAELGVLTSLSQLSLAKNSLHGKFRKREPSFHIAAFLVNSCSLIVHATGSIPSSLGNLKDIKLMQFALNQLTGTIPSSFERFTKLERFILHVNQLTGTLPRLWGDDFKRLRINNNKLIGSIPQMPTQMPLEWFQVSDNSFSVSRYVLTAWS